jgi:hypothetical protein
MSEKRRTPKTELSEDAVKQRLSRGRKLLHQEVLAFVGLFTAIIGPVPGFKRIASMRTAATAGPGLGRKNVATKITT